MPLRTDNPIVKSGKMTYEQGVKVYGDYIKESSETYGIPKNILSKMLFTESNFNVNATSPVGAKGLAQFMPATAKEMGVDVTDPKSSIMGMGKYMQQAYKKFNDWNLAVASYNAGMGAVSKYKGIPPFKETQNYVKKVLGGIQDNNQTIKNDQPQTYDYTPSLPIPANNINYEMINEFQKIMNETKQVIKKENMQVEDAKSKLMERQNAISFIKELKLNYTPFKPQ